MKRITSIIEFEDLIKKHTVVAIFYAEWSAECKAVNLELDKLSKNNKDIIFVKINIDMFVALTNFYQIMSIPTLILFEGGKELRRQSGTITALQFTKFLKR